MAYNVFGNPITNETLEGMPEYAGKKVIARLDRARVALNMKNAQEKDVNARKHAEKLKQQYGNGISTLCLVYNATGETLNFANIYNWWGHIGPSPYPQQIANGQWGVFLHVKTSGTATGSTAAVVYRGKNANGADCDWMMSWSNPWNRWSWDNTVYEIREAHHYETDYWDYIKGELYASGIKHNDKWNGCLSTVTTGNGTTVVFEAILTLENA